MLQNPMKASHFLCSVILLFVWPMSTNSKQWLLLWVVASDRVGEYKGVCWKGISQNSTEVDAKTKESTRKTEEKLDGRYKEGHE